ncbi:hypothetical protein [Paenibacillus shenyangensis]|uniref:hypothetical protein n=1 Tax=Paenibacillus sp. A9 TaxID=1284352 RepID=UPI000381F658|nr:hypothetical protein [Paenibacillus sp. A9]
MKRLAILSRSKFSILLIICVLFISICVLSSSTVSASRINTSTQDRLKQQYNLDQSHPNNDNNNSAFWNVSGDWGYSYMAQDKDAYWLRLGWVLWTSIQ